MPELSLVTERGPLGAAASSVDEHRLQEVQHEGSAPVAPRLRCSSACAIFWVRDQARASTLAGGFFPPEPPGKPSPLFSWPFVFFPSILSPSVQGDAGGMHCLAFSISLQNEGVSK